MNSIISSPLITISIISHGDSKKVENLVKSIGDHENLDNIQLIVTENLAEKNTEQKPETSIYLQNKTPKGFAKNHNQAFNYVKGEYFCVLNPDIVFLEPVFKHLISHINADRADIVSPMIVDSKNIVQDSFRELPTPQKIIARRLLRKPEVTKPSKKLSPDWLAGMFLFMRADTFKELGGFDERYFLYFEDVDFCVRARFAGLKLLLDPALKVQHDAHRGSQHSIKYLFWHLQSAWRFFTSTTYQKAK